jgi:hypothetical protein
MYGWMAGWMCASLAPENLDRSRSHSVLTSLRVIGRHPVNLNMNSKKTGDLHMSAKKNSDFIENGYKYFDKILVLHGGNLLK